MRRYPDKDCRFCFIDGCDCECATCVAAQSRNDRMSSAELGQLMVDAFEPFREIQPTAETKDEEPQP